MSIATAIQNAQQRVANAYTAISNKGGTLPATQNLSNMPTAIASIPSGGGTDNLPAFVSTGVSTFTDNTITKIRPYAFYENNTTNTTNPITSISCSSVSSIGTYAFHKATSLQSINFSSVTSIGSGSFNYCSSLQNISIPSVVSIDDNAFRNCTSLTALNLPNGLNTIGSHAFDGCSGVITLTIPSSVTSIGTSTFSGLTNATEVNYNATSVSSASYCFESLGKNVNNLTFNIGSNVEKIPQNFLKGNTYFPKIQTLNIPSTNSITEIGQYAFQKCTALNSQNFDNVTTVGTYAFTESSIVSLSMPSLTLIITAPRICYNCPSLTTVSLPNLTKIRNASGFTYAFASCPSLTSVDLSSLTDLTGGKQLLQNAFRSCTSLTTLSFPALTSTSFGSYTNQFNNMLYGVTGCTVHFPSNLQSVIGSWSDVTAGFGGTNTTVLFDLTATT